MKRKNTYTSVFDTNRVILFCIIFTVSMIATLGVTILSGVPFYFNTIEFFAIFIFCVAPVVTFVLFDYTPGLKYFRDDRCNPWLSILAHYLISLGLIVLSVFVLSFFEPFYSTPNWIISRKVVFQYTPGYVVIILGMIIIDVRRTSIANSNLIKIKANKRSLDKK